MTFAQPLRVVRLLGPWRGTELEARSDGPGQGSEFVLTLPVLPEGSLKFAHPPAEVEQSANLQLRILVVDDNVDAAEGLTGLLAAWGYTAHAVHDGAAALEAVASLSPDVVLLDLDLPKIHGYDVASRVRLTNDASRLMLVALTGFGQEQHRERTTEAGFDHHLVKPVDLSALRRLLSRNAMAKKIRWTDLAV